jgi:transcriptional regulator with XRE-family HTH domain
MHIDAWWSDMGNVEPQIVFGKTISGIRKLKRMTQTRLGEKAGKSAVYISAVECGRINPTLDTILTLCNALEVEPGDLFYLAFSTESREKKELKKEFAEILRKLENVEQKILMKIIRALAEK